MNPYPTYTFATQQAKHDARLRDMSADLGGIEDGLCYWSSMFNSILGDVEGGSVPHGARDLCREAADDFERYANTLRALARR